MSHILVVDDEPSICWGFRELLGDDGHKVSTAASAEDALELLEHCRPDAMILDVRLPGMDGLSAIAKLRERAGEIPIIIITAFSNLPTAVRAVELGAFDYLPKPFDLDEAAEVIRRALDKSPREPQQAEEEPSTETLIGTSAAMQTVFKQIALVASSEVPVLITGESGTGKELVARAIHRHSTRRNGPYVPVNLAALSPTVIESELFGHVRGAFTGAESDRKGLLELAGGGTVMLDEIGDVPLSLQVKLLRAIEQREITPVGDTRPRSTDIRFLAATNRPLVDLMNRGEFREDLFFRLSVVHIEVPPLRDRSEDILPLAEFFLRQLGAEHAHKRFSGGARDALLSRPWQGNVRELRNAIERAAIMARGDAIDAAHLPRPLVLDTSATSESSGAMLARAASAWTVSQFTNGDSPARLHEAFLEAAEPAMLEAVLAQCNQNRTLAARVLGLHRATLREKLRRYGIDASER